MKSEAQATYKELEIVKKKYELLERQFEMRVFDQTLEIERKARKQMKLELALACVRYANDYDRAVQDLKLTLNELLEEQRFRGNFQFFSSSYPLRATNTRLGY